MRRRLEDWFGRHTIVAGALVFAGAHLLWLVVMTLLSLGGLWFDHRPEYCHGPYCY